jgi:hypothetical protein
MQSYVKKYNDLLNTPLKRHNIAVFGMLNSDIEYNISKKEITYLNITPVLNKIIRKIIKNHDFGEYDVKEEEINNIIKKLERLKIKNNKIPGGNAANIALALKKLNLDITLIVRHFPKYLSKTFEGIKVIYNDNKELNHLIFQLGKDRFILSSDFGDKDPQLIIKEIKNNDMTVYSGAHLDARSILQQKIFFNRLKKLKSLSKILYFEFGDIYTTKFSRKNCIESVKVSDIIGINDKEIEGITEKSDFIESSLLFYKKYLKSEKILLVHSYYGNLVVVDREIKNIEKAQIFGALVAAARVRFREFLTLKQIKDRFKKFKFNKIPIQFKSNNKIKKNNLTLSWVPSPKIPVKRSVGAGDAFTAGFAKGFLEFCVE